jgi:hypothetical protein
MGKLMVVRKVADKTGEKLSGGSWPMAGIELVDPPDACNVPVGWVDKAVAEGWITLEGARMVNRPGGPADDPTRVIHKFTHIDALVIDTIDGEVRYRVVHQPDKYVADGDDDTPMTDEHYAAGNSRVDWFYGIEREA